MLLFYFILFYFILFYFILTGKVFVDYQLELLAAAKENKVKLFIPSEFGSDTEGKSKNKNNN